MPPVPPGVHDSGATASGPGADGEPAVGPGPSSSPGDPAVPPLPDQLAALDAVDADLQRTVAGFGEADLRADSLCAGWTRAHVLAHLARNADALGNLVTWATTGVRTPTYASMEARAEAIETGAARDAAAIAADIAASSATFRERAEELRDRDDLTEVRTGATDLAVPGDHIAWHRAREIVTHHLDLDAGYGVHDVDPDLMRRLLTHTVWMLADRDDFPPLTLIEVTAAGPGTTWRVGGADETDPGTTVRGTAGAFYLWLMRGVAHDLRAEADLPDLPAWG